MGSRDSVYLKACTLMAHLKTRSPHTAQHHLAYRSMASIDLIEFPVRVIMLLEPTRTPLAIAAAPSTTAQAARLTTPGVSRLRDGPSVGGATLAPPPPSCPANTVVSNSGPSCAGTA
eukprot:CAMPEP_0115843120 /NCGR_PEP_ID=MMETSP0287-20121206/8150_1 /TAXON_ID=412157 /ORGANISM="Chrysochromulina rotalis, Strain UIO044" /LENGTH=116 /DNA_ID=CAMNT_0003296807 /DNA_START=132 /DNA_END=482 /DNA_ORIENTATION=-